MKNTFHYLKKTMQRIGKKNIKKRYGILRISSYVVYPTSFLIGMI